MKIEQNDEKDRLAKNYEERVMLLLSKLSNKVRPYEVMILVLEFASDGLFFLRRKHQIQLTDQQSLSNRNTLSSLQYLQDTEIKDTEIQKFSKLHEELLKMREETEENRKTSRREIKAAARKAEEAVVDKDYFSEDEFDEDDEEEEIESDSDDGREHDPGDNCCDNCCVENVFVVNITLEEN